MNDRPCCPLSRNIFAQVRRPVKNGAMICIGAGSQHPSPKTHESSNSARPLLLPAPLTNWHRRALSLPDRGHRRNYSLDVLVAGSGVSRGFLVQDRPSSRGSGGLLCGLVRLVAVTELINSAPGPRPNRESRAPSMALRGGPPSAPLKAIFLRVMDAGALTSTRISALSGLDRAPLPSISGFCPLVSTRRAEHAPLVCRRGVDDGAGAP